MLRRHKIRLQYRLVSLWYTVDKATIPDLPALAARNLRAIIFRLFRGRRLWVTVLRSFIGSWLLTVIVFVPLYVYENPKSFPFVFLPDPLLFVVNYVFDAATVLVTLWALKVVITKSAIKGILAILVDLSLAGFFTFFCYIGFMTTTVLTQRYPDWLLPGLEYQTETTLRVLESMGLKERLRQDGFTDNAQKFAYEVFDVPAYFREGVPAIYYLLRGENYRVAKTLVIEVKEEEREATYQMTGTFLTLLSYPATTLTTFLPSAVFLLSLLLLIVARLILVATQAVVKYILELVTEADPERDPKQFMPGTLLGVFLGTVSTTLKAAYEIFHVFR